MPHQRPVLAGGVDGVLAMRDALDTLLPFSFLYFFFFFFSPRVLFSDPDVYFFPQSLVTTHRRAPVDAMTHCRWTSLVRGVRVTMHEQGTMGTSNDTAADDPRQTLPHPHATHNHRTTPLLGVQTRHRSMVLNKAHGDSLHHRRPMIFLVMPSSFGRQYGYPRRCDDDPAEAHTMRS